MVAARHHARLISIEAEGKGPRPVCLPVRMRSLTRACGWWRVSRNCAVPAGVFVAMSWSRQPSCVTSVDQPIQ